MAGETYRIAGKMSDDYRMFLSELLEAKIQMSGWYNIFFCAQDVKIKESLIQNLIRYNYRNHLAHVYIYAYDNKPEIVKKANQSEELLIYFSRGIRIAKKLGILFAVAGGSGLTWATFYLNRRFGPHGLMKLLALRQHPRHIIHRRSVRRLLERRTLPKR